MVSTQMCVKNVPILNTNCQYLLLEEYRCIEITAMYSVDYAGSMVPFDMRMLHAEFPQHVGRLHDSVDKLCHLRTVISQVFLLIFCMQ